MAVLLVKDLNEKTSVAGVNFLDEEMGLNRHVSSNADSGHSEVICRAGRVPFNPSF